MLEHSQKSRDHEFIVPSLNEGSFSSRSRFRTSERWSGPQNRIMYTNIAQSELCQCLVNMEFRARVYQTRMIDFLIGKPIEWVGLLYIFDIIKLMGTIVLWSLFHHDYHTSRNYYLI